MLVGGLAVLAMAVLASVVIATYLEWENAADALSTVAMVSSVPVVGGALVALFGRWVYGDWTGSAPLLRVSSWLVRVIGIVLTAALGVMLALLVFAGVGPEDGDVAVSLGIGIIGGLGLVLIGFLIAPRSPA
jgi:hypothetical protein